MTAHNRTTLQFSPVNKKLGEIKESASMAASQLARDLKQQGREIISLATGEPDFATPDHIKQACIDALNANHTSYPPVTGVDALKKAIQYKFKEDNQLSYELDEIIVGNGVKQILFNALAASLDAGQEVIIPTPGWVSYSDMVRLNDGVPVELPTTWESNFRIDPSQLDSLINENTRWVLLNNPCNPSGTLFSEAEIRALAAVLEKHPHVMILSDDIYEHIRFDGREYFTIAQVSEEIKERTLVANGVSKSWCMTGWRVGFAAGNKQLINAMKKLQGQTTGGVMHPAQYAAAVALTEPKDFMVEHLAEYTKRRDLCVNHINNIPGLSCKSPEASFYVFVRCAEALGKTTPSGSVLKSDLDVTSYLIEHAGVVCVPGAAFGMSPFFRISFACDIEVLEQALVKIDAAMHALEN